MTGFGNFVNQSGTQPQPPSNAIPEFNHSEMNVNNSMKNGTKRKIIQNILESMPEVNGAIHPDAPTYLRLQNRI